MYLIYSSLAINLTSFIRRNHRGVYTGGHICCINATWILVIILCVFRGPTEVPNGNLEWLPVT